jgi:1-acyl-sn-glycerol-3-phosphate acyltransferase
VCRGRTAPARAHGDDWSHNSLEVLHALEAVGVRIEITGTDHFSRLEGPCVFIGNHMSTLEAFVLPTIIQPLKRVAFVVKKSLVEYPIFGHLMRSRNPIVVGRTNPREDLKAVFDGGVERLRSGISIVVFPQKTRSALFDPAAFNSIGVKLAKGRRSPSSAGAQDRRLGQRALSGLREDRPAKSGAFRVRRTAAGAGLRVGRTPAGRRVHSGASRVVGGERGAGPRSRRALMPTRSKVTQEVTRRRIFALEARNPGIVA